MTLKEYIIQQLKKYLGIKSPSKWLFGKEDIK